MDIGPLSMERGAFRIEIDGTWTCQEFSSFLHSTDDIYRRLNSVFILRRALDHEARSNREYEERSEYDRRDLSWHNQVFGTFLEHHAGTTRFDPPAYLRLVELTSALSEPLSVDAIVYGSPGWIQLIGSLNPLKVLADFITKWRAENTKREANRLRIQTDTLRIQAELAAKILEQAPKMPGHTNGGASRLIDLAEEVVKPTALYLDQVARNRRVIDAKVVPPSEPLPLPTPS